MTTIRHLRFIRPDVAVIDSPIDIWRRQELRLHLLSTFVVTKEEGKWLIFTEAVACAEAFGFRLSRTSGSHHIYVHADIPELVHLQHVNGKAKP